MENSESWAVVQVVKVKGGQEQRVS
jgi:hypothetical protein